MGGKSISLSLPHRVSSLHTPVGVIFPLKAHHESITHFLPYNLYKHKVHRLVIKQHVAAINAYLCCKTPLQTHHHDLTLRPILRILLQLPPVTTNGRGCRNQFGRRARHVDYTKRVYLGKPRQSDRDGLCLFLSWPLFVIFRSRGVMSSGGSMWSTLASAAGLARPKKKFHFNVTFCLQDLRNCTYVSGLMFAKMRLKSGGSFTIHSDRSEH